MIHAAITAAALGLAFGWLTTAAITQAAHINTHQEGTL